MKTITIILSLFLSFNSLAQDKEDNVEWDDKFMPGVGYKSFISRNTKSYYHGLAVDFIFYAKSKSSNEHKNNYYSYRSRGPGKIKTYGSLGILSNSSSDKNDLLSAQIGVNLSFESAVKRSFAVPYFGLESGGMFKRGFSTLTFTPTVGLQLYSSRTIIISSQIGYQYATSSFEENSGTIFNTSINLLLWK